jgi:hypothetical protein
MDEAKRINWLLDHEMIVNMLGFEEAYQSALKVRFICNPSWRSSFLRCRLWRY